MMKLFTWNNVKKVAVLVTLAWQQTGFPETDTQLEMRYFGSDIDYWHEKGSKSVISLTPSKSDEEQNKTNNSKPTEVASTDSGSFPWTKYTDPKNKEFFKEGDYTPPEPFMEIVRNPTDANLKMWFAYIDKKNELSRQLQERMKEYMAKNGLQGQPGADIMKAKLATLPITETNSKRFRFRMYFDSHCPHCKKMFGTLSDLQVRGFFVEAKQVDSGSLITEGLNIPTSRATLNELQEKDIQSVPVLFIGDLENKKVYRLTGYQTTTSVFAAITQGNAMTKGSMH